MTNLLVMWGGGGGGGEILRNEGDPSNGRDDFEM